MRQGKRTPPSCSREGGFLWSWRRVTGCLAVGVVLLCGAGIVSAHAAETEEPVVVEVAFEGIQALSLGEVEAVVSTQPQQPLSLALVREDIRAVYALGYFRHVGAAQAASGEGVVVTYEVVEQPVVGDIEFDGAAVGDVPDLRSVITLEIGRPWSASLAIASRDEMVKYYRRSGYTQAQVEVVPPPAGDEDTWVAHFTIDRGPRARILDVEFTGNEFLSSTTLSSVIGSRYSTFFDPKALEDDMQQVVRKYQKYGFYFCQVSPENYEYLERYGEPWIKVFLRVDEGPRVMMGQVNVAGNQAFSDSEIRAAFSPRPGNPFDLFAARDSISAIQTMYGAKGYLYVTIDNSLHYNEQSGFMDIKLVIDENDQMFVGNIIVEGNDTTQWMVFKHMLLLKPGDVFSSTRMIESWRRLYNLGFFGSVTMEPVPTDDPTVLDLLIRVEELDRWGELYLGASYNGTYGFEGFIQFQRDNLWGQGKLVSVNWEFGAQTNDYELAYTDRWLFDSSTQLDFQLYSDDSSYYDDDEGYTEYKSGVEVGLGSPWFSDLSVFLYTRRQSTIIGKIEGKELPSGLTEGTSEYLSLKPALKWDSRVRDKGFNPYQGLYAYVSFEKAGGFLGGTVDFNRYFLEGRTYLRTASFWTAPTLALRVRQMWGDNLPVEEEFYVGGQESLRGYSLNEFRGTSVLLGTAELRVPFDETTLGYLFVDAAGITRQDAGYLAKVGFGFGIKLQTVIGTLRLDYGVGEAGDGMFYFGMGSVF